MTFKKLVIDKLESQVNFVHKRKTFKFMVNLIHSAGCLSHGLSHQCMMWVISGEWIEIILNEVETTASLSVGFRLFKGDSTALKSLGCYLLMENGYLFVLAFLAKLGRHLVFRGVAMLAINFGSDAFKFSQNQNKNKFSCYDVLCFLNVFASYVPMKMNKLAS